MLYAAFIALAVSHLIALTIAVRANRLATRADLQMWRLARDVRRLDVYPGETLPSCRPLREGHFRRTD